MNKVKLNKIFLNALSLNKVGEHKEITQDVEWENFVANGVDTLSIKQAKRNSISSLVVGGACVQDGTPTPNSPVSIKCNNGILSVRRKNGLPLAYKKVKYIGSTGDQYINTGFVIPDLTEEYKVEYKIAIDGGTAQDSPSNNWGYMGQNGVLMLTLTRQCGVGAGSEGVPLVKDHIYDIVQTRGSDSSRQLIVDGEVFEFSSQASIYADRPFGIFRLSPFETQFNRIYGKIYEFKVYKNGTLIMNLIPCVREVDSVVGLYDEVNDKFLINSGSGTFTTGQEDINNEIELFADGLAEKLTINEEEAASVQNLLSLQGKIDEQSIIDGIVTNRVGVKILTGKENIAWAISENAVCTAPISTIGLNNASLSASNEQIRSNYFVGSSFTPSKKINNGVFITSTAQLGFSLSAIGTTAASINNWLVNKFVSGNPVIILYPLDNDETKAVEPQSVSNSSGNVTISRESGISGLPIEATLEVKASPPYAVLDEGLLGKVILS